MEKTVIELFAGVGGFRIGLESASDEFKTLWANQWEPSRVTQHAFDCYNNHFGHISGINQYSNVDISKVNTEDIPNHTLLVGGFPCQDYSVASTGAKGIQGKKGVLWWEIVRIIEAKKPPFILLENVDRLLKSPSKQRGRDFGIMLKCFEMNGYNVEWRVINAADYGFQQKRRRIFIFASRNDTKYANIFNLTSESIISKHGMFAQTFPIDCKMAINSHNIDYDIVNISKHYSYHFSNSGFMHNGTIYTTNTTPSQLIINPPLTLGNMLETNVPEKYYLSDEEYTDWVYLKGPKTIPRTSKDGHEYVFREGAIPFPDKLDIPARTMLTSEKSKNRSSHIVEDSQTGRFRKLTPIECEKINGFPPNWTNTGMPESFRYFCMGNALVVNLIKEMGIVINKIISKE